MGLGLIGRCTGHVGSSRPTGLRSIYLGSGFLSVLGNSSTCDLLALRAEETETITLLLAYFFLHLGLVPFGTCHFTSWASIQVGVIMEYQLAVKKVLGEGAEGGVGFCLRSLDRAEESRQLANDYNAAPTTRERAAKSIWALDVSSDPPGNFVAFSTLFLFAVVAIICAPLLLVVLMHCNHINEDEFIFLALEGVD